MTKIAFLSLLALPVLSATLVGCTFSSSSGDCSQGPFDVCKDFEGRAIAELSADVQGGVFSATTSQSGDVIFAITDGMGKLVTVRPRDKEVTERRTNQPEGCITTGLAAFNSDVWIGLSCDKRASVYHAHIDADDSTEVLSVENARLTSIQATSLGMVASIASGGEARLYEAPLSGDKAPTIIATRPRSSTPEKLIVLGDEAVQWSGASFTSGQNAIYQVTRDVAAPSRSVPAGAMLTIFESTHTIVNFDYFGGRLCVERRNGASLRNHDIVLVEKNGSLTSLFQSEASSGERSIPSTWLTSFGTLYAQNSASEGLDVFETTERPPTPLMNLEGKRLLGVMSGTSFLQWVVFSVPGERRIRVAEVIRTAESLRD